MPDFCSKVWRSEANRRLVDLASETSTPSCATSSSRTWLPGEDPQRAELVGHVDAAIGELMEAILHHPEFQALEASWRGIYFLVSQLDTGRDLEIYLLDFAKEELASDLKSSEDLSRTILYKAMVEETVQTPGASPWALLAANYLFGLESGDIESLGRVAKIASVAGAPFVAAAGASLIGCESFAATRDPDDWSLGGGTAVSQAWEAVRHLPEASSLGLILPRFLLRLPYGKESDPIESLPFEELSTPPEHEHYLWGTRVSRLRSCSPERSRSPAGNSWKESSRI